MRSGPPGDEMELLRQHNEALMRKLEKKVRQLEAEIAGAYAGRVRAAGQ